MLCLGYQWLFVEKNTSGNSGSWSTCKGGVSENVRPTWDRGISVWTVLCHIRDQCWWDTFSRNKTTIISYHAYVHHLPIMSRIFQENVLKLRQPNFQDSTEFSMELNSFRLGQLHLEAGGGRSWKVKCKATNLLYIFSRFGIRGKFCCLLLFFLLGGTKHKV